MATRFYSLTSNAGLRHFWTRPLMIQNRTYTKSNATPTSTVDANEVEKFTKDAQNWWRYDTHNQVLLSMNTLRVPLIRDGILSISRLKSETPIPLKGCKIIDIGCGGGLLSEPLARLGANVTGLDPGAENIEAANHHVLLDEDIKGNIKYVCDSVENFVQTSAERFNALVCSEVIEHVTNPQLLVTNCVELVKDGGSLFFTTSNRTALSFVANVLAAEYVLGIVPKGTHNWNKFVRPKELSDMLESSNCRIVSIEGIVYNPLTKQFKWCDDTSMMYALHAIK